MHYPQTIIYDLLLASNRGIIEGYDIPVCFLSSPIESDLSHESKEPNYDEISIQLTYLSQEQVAIMPSYI